MDDRQLVAALRSGDAHSLAAVHDAYGSQLYDYAYGILQDREAAEDAVHDALLVAVGRHAVLRDPDQAPIWLYALTRNECLRQTTRSRVASRPRLADARDETVMFGAADLRAEQARAWLRDAVAGLAPLRREALDLTVRHRLVEVDVATVTGVGIRRATSRARSAHADLDRALGSLLTARTGHGDCAELDELLAGWNGKFTRAVYQKVSDHAERCERCGGAVRGGGGSASRYADLPMTPAPKSLRTRLLATAEVPDRIVYRGEVAEPFQRSGFPVPLDGPRRRHLVLIWAAVALVILAFLGGIAYALRTQPDDPVRNSVDRGAGITPVSTPSGPPRTPSGASGRGSSSPSPSASPSASKSASPSATPSGNPSPSPPAGNDPGTRVDALIADSTLGCPQEWRATVTANIRGNAVRQVTFFWGETPSPSNEVRMRRVNDGIYQAVADDLPMDVTIHWRVVATTDSGTTSTGIDTTRHRRQC